MEMGEWAFISCSEDSVILGEGPFTKFAECPIGETAFYRNNFDLSDQEPWLVPSRVYEIRRDDLPNFFKAEQFNELEWEEPEVEAFSEVFREIANEITSGRLLKSVPVVVEKAKASKEAFQSLISNLVALNQNLNPYGFFSEGEGFLGASPEFLFRSFEGKLKTMALAGTATESERSVFSVDEKEIQEHEFVAQPLQDTLSPLGMTRRHQRSILSLGSLIHFHTAIDVELYHSHHPDDLIKRLHPTPALGSLPRTPEAMEQLFEWRSRLGCPSYFGAPFGVYHKGHLDLLVSIRLIGYGGEGVIIPSGCGVIEASRLTSEWRELALKRASVKKLLNL